MDEITLEGVREIMFSQKGCDCDAAYLNQRWPAYAHASDCPVYERWRPLEARLRRRIHPPDVHQ